MADALGSESSALKPVHVSIPLPTLEHVLAALEAGLEAAREEHDTAVLQYGERRPARVKWYGEQVELIESAIADLRRTPCWAWLSSQADRAERGDG